MISNPEAPFPPLNPVEMPASSTISWAAASTIIGGAACGIMFDHLEFNFIQYVRYTGRGRFYEKLRKRE